MTRIVEGVHQAVWSTLGFRGAAPGRTRGLTGFVYRSLYAATQRVGDGADAVLAEIEARLGESEAEEAPRRATARAILNGVMGDRLAADGNPLSIPMELHLQGQTLDLDTLSTGRGMTGKIAVLIHGLCMDERAWHVPDGDGYGDMLAGLGYTPVFVRYNSGRHTSESGRELATLLEQLVERWPVPVETLEVLAHSMGGLVIRGAVHYAREGGAHWPEHLDHLVFLGTPHHGAPLERAGNWVDAVLGSTRYTTPFAALGQLRSAGITDLRYGHVLDRDWKGEDRFLRTPDQRQPLPLPEGVACYAVAATRSAEPRRLADRIVGDGLVPVQSALGQHEEAALSLGFSDDAQYIAYATDHFELLRSPAVIQQIETWLGRDANAA